MTSPSPVLSLCKSCHDGEFGEGKTAFEALLAALENAKRKMTMTPRAVGDPDGAQPDGESGLARRQARQKLAESDQINKGLLAQPAAANDKLLT
jgi:hypothetical protein